MRVANNERRWVWWVALVILVATTLPYLIGFQTQSDAWRFSGFVFGVDDGNTYIAKMLRGASGDWLFRTPYSAYPQRGFLAFVPYYLLGKLAAPPNLHTQLVALFQVFRWLAGLVMIWATYAFISAFVADVRLRSAATLLALLGGGLGFLQVFGLAGLWSGRVALEFYSPETFGFLSLFGLPHLALARALLLAGLLCAQQGLDQRSRKLALLAGFLWLALGLAQPLSVVTAWAVFGVYVLLRRSGDAKGNLWQALAVELRIAIIPVLISAPIVLYSFLSFQLDPFLAGWGEQNRIFSPPPGDYLLAFGLLLPFAAIGAWQAWKTRSSALLLVGWALIFPLLAYAPYNLQRRLPEGIWVALVVLAVQGAQRLGARWRKPVSVVFGLSFLTTLLVLVGAVFTVAQPAEPLYQRGEVVEAYQFLAENAQKDDVVLAPFAVSNALPAYAPLRTLTGHGPESVNAAEINPRVTAFLTVGTPDVERLALLHEMQVRYYLHVPGVEEVTWQPEAAAYLALIYQNEEAQVYRVTELPE